MRSRRLLTVAAIVALSGTIGLIGCDGDSSSSSSSGSSDTTTSSSSSSNLPEGWGELTGEDGVVSENTEPGDFNIYLYSATESAERDHLYGWYDGGDAYFEASATGVTIDEVGEEYSFVAFYMDIGTTYDVTTGWKGASGEGTYAFTAANMFTGILFTGEGASSSQTGNFNLDMGSFVFEDDGTVNLYLYDTYPDTYGLDECVVYYTLDDFIEATENERVGDPEVSENTVHGETEPGDFNIYYYDLSGWTDFGRTDRNWLYTWNALSIRVEQSGDDFATIEGIKFVPFYFNFGTVYSGYTDWSGTNTKNFRITESSLISDGLFRDESGSTQTADVSIISSSLVADEDGHYNVFIAGGDKEDPTTTYYSFEEFEADVAI